MKDIIIHNWDELQSIIFKDVWQDNIKRYRSDFIYRGVGDAKFGMQSKLARVCSHNLELEDSLLRNFKKYGYSELSEYSTGFWQVLTLAQHHGLPTRLLDWSYSPLVAAHFATDEIERYDVDGCIYCFDYSKIRDQLPIKMKDMLAQEDTQLFSIEMLESVAKDFDELKSLSNKPFALFFEPASIHNRVVNQYALFSLVTDSSIDIDTILENYPDYFYRIIIPKEVKLEIRDKLDYINISERMIYPGLDGICKWITRRYANLGPKYNNNK